MPVIDHPVHQSTVRDESHTYGCQHFDIGRKCRFDKRAKDSRCNGCQRETDRAYLESQGLWIEGISHRSGS